MQANRVRYAMWFVIVSGAYVGAAKLGLELSLVARFAEAHGGRAWAEDRPGGGASLRVLLPDCVT